MPSSKKDLRSQCPVGFEAVNLDDTNNCPLLEDVVTDRDNSSLWLMKVPYDFNLESLTGQTVILNGSQHLSLDVTQGREKKRYEMHSRAGSTAELSSFTVLLPSSKRKSFCSAGTFSGQMSVIQSVVVPPSTKQEVPESSRQSSAKKAKRTSSLVEDDMVSSSSTKKKKNKEQNHITEESFLESPKHKKDKRKTDVAETPNEVSDKHQKRDSPKKIKEKERHKVDLTQSRFEPKAERTTIGEQCLIQSPKKRKKGEVVEKQGNSEDSPFTSNEKSPRKRKTDVVEIQGNNEESPLMSSKKKKKRKSSDTGSPESALLEETIPRSKSDKDSCLEVKNMDSIKHKKDKSGHESEPEKSRKKKKHSKMKTG